MKQDPARARVCAIATCLMCACSGQAAFPPAVDGTLPDAGTVLRLVEIVPLNIRGQGIAWDRSQPGVLYGIIRATAQEHAAGVGNRVTVSRLIDER